MSFAELLKLKEELGSKVYNEALFGEDSTAKRRKKDLKQRAEFKRENKNRPREISAKKQVPLLGKVKATKSDSAPRDPRFDERCGDFDRDSFKSNYSFVNEIREKEITELKTQLKKLKSDQVEEKTKVKLVLQRMQNQNLEEKKLQERRQAKVSEKKTNKTAIKNERKPFFAPKRECSPNVSIKSSLFSINMFSLSSLSLSLFSLGEQKAQELVKQFEELKQSGRLNKHLEKRRKKNLSRDRKKYQFN